jgi:DNA-binding NarL/FixJ family response regulator
VLRILIADDHEVIRNSLRGLLSRREGWQICGEAVHGREAVEMAKRLRPDIVVLDVSMPLLNGIEVTFQIRKALPRTEILIITMHETKELVEQVMSAGARAYLLKSDATAHIEAAVETLAKHKSYFSPSIANIMLDAITTTVVESQRGPIVGPGPLTVREREVMQLLAEGKTNKQIATLLGLTVATAQTHRATIMRKLHLSSVAELVRYAVRNKVIEP